MTTLIMDPTLPEAGAVVVNDDGRLELYGHSANEHRREYLRRLWVNGPHDAIGPIDWEVIFDADDELVARIRQAEYRSVDVIESPYENAPEYTVSYGSLASLADDDEDKVKDPVMAVSLNGSLVRIAGSSEIVWHYRSYFSAPDRGWGQHLQEEQPLHSFWGRQYMTHARAVTEEEFKSAVAKILADGGEQTIVTW